MNAHTHITEASQDHDARRKARLVAQQANIARLVDRLQKLHDNPASDWRWLQALDAAQHVFTDADFSELIDVALHELRLSEEGFPLNSDGDVIPDADREFIPCVRVMPS
jgi:hypothetical protein